MKKELLAYTTDFAGVSTSNRELYETLKKIAEAGFSHIHWCHEWNGDYTYSKAEMLQIRGWMKDLGLKCKGVHATEGCRRTDMPNRFHYRCISQDRKDYTSENEYNRQAGVELVWNRIELASILEAEAIVLHMQLPYKSFEEEDGFKERYYRQVFKSFDELEGKCKQKRIRICVENMIGTPNVYQIEQFDKLFERYDSDFLGLCFDTGHGLITGNGNSLEIAQRYKDRLYMMHMDDNHGLQGEECWEDAKKMCTCDEHLNPFMGNVDWEGFAKIVAASPYQLPVVMEVSKRTREEKEFLEESLLTGKRFTEMVLKYRQ